MIAERPFRSGLCAKILYQNGLVYICAFPNFSYWFRFFSSPLKQIGDMTMFEFTWGVYMW